MKSIFCKSLAAILFFYGFAVAAFADALDHWTSEQITNQANEYASDGAFFTSVASGNGVYVAVGQYAYGDPGFIESSNDGTNWTLPSTMDGIAYGPVMPWDLFDVTYGNGIFVACGWDYAQGGNLYSSPDGINWTAHQSKITDIYRVIYGNGLFVAVGDGFPTNGDPNVLTNKNIFTSPDGTNWTAQNSGSPANDVHFLSDVAWGAGKFIAVDNDSHFYTSSSGTAWTRTTSSYPLAGNVSFCNGLFIVPSGPGTNLLSPNGTTWSAVTNTTATMFGRVIYTNGLYVAIPTSALFVNEIEIQQVNAAIFTSTDATNWAQRNYQGPTNEMLTDIVFGGRNFVAVGFENNLNNSPAGPDISTVSISDPIVALALNPGFPPQLEVSGVQNWNYGIQYSAGLNPANWQTLTNFTLSNSPLIWTDGTATNSQRYYRAAWLP
jgi:hypothetical protein